MRRKTSTVPTRIWTFGCLPPTENAELFHNQLFHAHRYWNTLVEIELKGREAYRAARAKLPDLEPVEKTYSKLCQLIKDLRQKRKDQNKKARSRVDNPALDAEIKTLIAQRAVAKRERDRLRQLVKTDPDFLAVCARINEDKTRRTKEARAATDAFWGSYLLREKAMEEARKGKMDPKFRRFDRTGRVGVQLQRGLTVAEALSGQDTRLQIVQRPGEHKKRHAKHLVRIRVGSEGRAPIWTTFPVILHRLLPADGRIMWAWILVSRTATSTKYKLQLSLESETFAVVDSGRGAVAVDFGWKTRVQGSRGVAPLDGIQVMKTVDDRGGIRDYVLPAALRQKLEHADSLHGIADRNFNEAREALVEWMRKHPEDVPEWMREATQYIHTWRSHAKLAMIAHTWFKESDCAQAQQLEAWRKQNRHLWQWEAHERAKALRRRRDIYRNWAAYLRKTYSHVVTEELDLRDLARNAAPEEDPNKNFTHYVRKIAAPGELRNFIKEKFGDSGTELPPNKRGHCEEGDSDFEKCRLLLRDAGFDTTKAEEKAKKGREVVRTLRTLQP